MHRFLLLLGLFTMAVLVGDAAPMQLAPTLAQMTETRLTEPQVTVAADDDCHFCPAEDADDCCSWDFGACCAPGLVALAEPPPQPTDYLAPLPQAEGEALPLHLLHPRDNGPPPTPPPIG